MSALAGAPRGTLTPGSIAGKLDSGTFGSLMVTVMNNIGTEEERLLGEFREQVANSFLPI